MWFVPIASIPPSPTTPPPHLLCLCRFVNSWHSAMNVHISYNRHLPGRKVTENPWIRLNLVICSAAIHTELCPHSSKASWQMGDEIAIGSQKCE